MDFSLFPELTLQTDLLDGSYSCWYYKFYTNSLTSGHKKNPSQKSSDFFYL